MRRGTVCEDRSCSAIRDDEMQSLSDPVHESKSEGIVNLLSPGKDAAKSYNEVGHYHSANGGLSAVVRASASDAVHCLDETN